MELNTNGPKQNWTFNHAQHLSLLSRHANYSLTNTGFLRLIFRSSKSLIPTAVGVTPVDILRTPGDISSYLCFNKTDCFFKETSRHFQPLLWHPKPTIFHWKSDTRFISDCFPNPDQVDLCLNLTRL